MDDFKEVDQIKIEEDMLTSPLWGRSSLDLLSVNAFMRYMTPADAAELMDNAVLSFGRISRYLLEITDPANSISPDDKDKVASDITRMLPGSHDLYSLGEIARIFKPWIDKA